MNCKNCSEVISSNFCPKCGQKSNVDKITIKYIANSVVDSVFQIEKGFLYTQKELIFRPAKSIKNFIEGKRVNFYKPFAYVILMSTITSLLVYLIDLYIRANRDVEIIYVDKDSIRYYFALAGRFFANYQSVFYFLMIPFVSIFSWIFFFKRFNFWENIVLNTYLTAQFNILIIIAQLSRLFIEGAVSYTPYLIIFFTYIGITYSKFFSMDNERKISFVLRIIVLIVLVVFLYGTGLSVAGIMSPWWG